MALLILLTSLLPAAGAGPQTAMLSGTVKNQDGRPIAGATVFISTAGPRKGVGHL